VQIFLRQKSINLKCQYKKAAHEAFAARKMLSKLTPKDDFSSMVKSSKMLVKLIPRGQFHQFWRLAFAPELNEKLFSGCHLANNT
jgi:hypothetical protein